MSNLAEIIKSGTVGTLIKTPEFHQQLRVFLPQHLSAEKMMRFFASELRAHDNLRKCTNESLYSAFIKCAQLGLEPGSLYGYCWILPFYNKRINGHECTFILGYKGMINLARRSKEVKTIQSFIVYSKDKFSREYGTKPKITHIPADGDRGEKIGVYAVAKLTNGEFLWEYLSRDEVEALRSRSKSANSGPWVTDEDEMWKKCPIRRLFKLLPSSNEMAIASQTIEEEESDAPVAVDIEEITAQTDAEEITIPDDDMSRTDELLCELDSKRGMRNDIS